MNKKENRFKNVSIKNRDIAYKYNIKEKIECGIELKGTEVKSIREGKANLKDSFAIIKDREVILKNMYIAPYDMGNINNVDPTRNRKLLLNKNEILKLTNYIKQGGYTLIPSKMYTSGRWVKIELCLCIGKKLYDKREALKEKEQKKQVRIYR